MSAWDQFEDLAGDVLRNQLIDMVKSANTFAPRTQQRHLGPSQIGDPCTKCLAAKILGVHDRGPFDDPWCAILGTATHSWLEKAAKKDNRNNNAAWCTEVRVFPDDDLLPAGGKADVYQDTTGTVIDHKIVGAPMLKKYKAGGPGLTYRRQAHLYGLGFAKTGVAVNTVAIAFWLRGGRLTDLYVWTEPYDETIALATLDRYRTLRELCETGGVAIVGSLPSDPGCFTCNRNNTAALKATA